MNTSDMVFLAIFFWGMFVVARVFIFASKINIKVKKKVWPLVIISLAITILTTAYGFNLPLNIFYILAPITAMIVFINLRGFYFCENCERMIAHKNIFNKPEKCANCKSSL